MQLLPGEKWTVQDGPHGLKHLKGAANGSKAACKGRWGMVPPFRPFTTIHDIHVKQHQFTSIHAMEPSDECMS